MNIEREVEKSLISCIVSRKGGVPLHELNDDFKALTGYSIPFLSLGYSNLLSFISNIKEIYFEKDENNNDVLIVDSKNSHYMKKLIENQKPAKRKCDMDHSYDFNYTISSIQSCMTCSQRSYSYQARRRKATLLRKEIMETLTPIMYGCQLLGDDILLEIAENSLMVHVNNTAPKRCGLCIVGQTMKDLIDNVNRQNTIPYRVAILIGLSDLLNNKKSYEMISDMELLITELKSKDINATILTLPKLNCIPKNCYATLRTFNDYIVSQANETQGITVMNLEHFYCWMTTCNDRPSSKWIYSKGLLHETERNIILCGLQDYFIRLKNEE